MHRKYDSDLFPQDIELERTLRKLRKSKEHKQKAWQMKEWVRQKSMR